MSQPHHVKKEEATLSENTRVKVGVVLTILIAFTGTLGGAVWWASAMTTKLDTLLDSQVTTKGEFSRVNGEVGRVASDAMALKQKVDLMDVIGSTRLRETREDIGKLQERIERLEELFRHSAKPN